MDDSPRVRPKASLRDLFVMTAVIAVVFSIFLPAIQNARSAARLSTCNDNFKRIGLAIHHYHNAFQALPMHGTGPTNESGDDPILAMQPGNEKPGGYSRHQLSYLVGILPFADQQALWEQIAYAHTDRHKNYWSAFGPAPYTANYEPWSTEVSLFRCPTDSSFGSPGLGRTNYACSVGDSMWRTDNSSWSYFKGSMWRYDGSNRLRAQQVKSSVRGVFVPRRQMSFKDIKDGLADTMMAAEIVTSDGSKDTRMYGSIMNGRDNVLGNPKYCLDQSQFDDQHEGINTWMAGTRLTDSLATRGARWADFRPIFTQVNTILPPNSELCMRGTHGQDGVMPPSSHHPGGVHILMGDGAVIFLTNNIEAGDPYAAVCYYRDNNNQHCVGEHSPYGLWGALGTRSARESISESG